MVALTAAFAFGTVISVPLAHPARLVRPLARHRASLYGCEDSFTDTRRTASGGRESQKKPALPPCCRNIPPALPPADCRLADAHMLGV
ncbi:hypothetical protein KCP76_02975 [Salmonella enterica subsp. enterica serovar Weltevreden]|nr:hypothetical protein KCP76_02975 [Salmonella enterica subsp. enterica serovar Weltevreden]